MKDLNKFISEKLKINKDIKNKYFSNNEWCIVVPFSETYDKFFDEYSDYEIMSDAGPNIFVITIDIAEKYKNSKDIDFMKIPDKYESFDEVKDDYEEGLIDLDELEKLKF